ncbi:hypothetical protein N7486_008558 [Penicillium sp. IBT 16267x]|nr:hypothetical protein N7486_008558 [Penicillium sp. IBT 16267x]
MSPVSIEQAYPQNFGTIIQYLRKSARKEPKHLSRLARTCRSLYQRILPLLYETVKLSWLIHAPRLVETIKKRPDLAPLIREIRHDDDTGFEDVIDFSVHFYDMVSRLPSLETLVFRKRLGVPWRNDIEWTKEEKNRMTFSKRCYLDRKYIEELVMNETLEDYSARVAHTARVAEEEGTLGPEDDPFGWGGNPYAVMADFEGHQEETIDAFWGFSLALRMKTWFCRGILGDYEVAYLPPKLRVCHIGTDAVLDVTNDKEDIPIFNETLFTLKRQPEKICITGAKFKWFLPGDEIPDEFWSSDASQVKELVFLNCDIAMEDLLTVTIMANGMKSFTFRGPLPREFEISGSFAELFRSEWDTMETLDLDVYWGMSGRPTGFHKFTTLKKLTITPFPCHKEWNEENAEIFQPGIVDFPVAEYEKALRAGEISDDEEFTDDELWGDEVYRDEQVSDTEWFN